MKRLLLEMNPRIKKGFRKTIVLLLLLCAHLSNAQESMTISGAVIGDDTKEPLIGVAIFIKGTTKGTITDINGIYALNVNRNDTLVFTYLGFIPEEIPVTNQKIIDVEMKSDVQTLDEVVVIGYGEVKKSDLTGSVAKIGVEDITKANANDAISALQGRVTGVQITQASGAPGSGVNIQVRGINSINAGTSPLYVIDGIQIAADEDLSVNPLLDLDPADIESMEILKDASATAVYGARGANGVVMITTKKGKSGKGKIDLNVGYGVTEMARRVDIMDNREFLEYQSRFVRLRALEEFPSAAFEDNIYDLALDAGLYNHPDFEPWLDQFSSPGYNAEFNLSTSGGTDDGNYRVSIGYNDQDGILDNSSLKRYTARINLNQKINEKTKIQFNVSGAWVDIEGLDESGANNGIFRRLLNTNPFLPLLNDPFTYLGQDIDINENLYDVNDSLARSRNAPSNFFLTEFAEDQNRTYRSRLSITYDLVKNLKLSLAGNINSSSRTQINSASPESRTAFDTNGEVRIRESKRTTWTAETKLAYNKTFNRKHRVNAIAVGELQRNYVDRTDIRNQGFGDFISGANNFGSGTIFVSEPFRSSTSSLASVLGRVNYTLSGKYVFTLSSRLDASSKFPDGNRSALFPAFAFAWNAHEEGFMEGIGLISNLKLRSSIGQTGNQNIPVGASQTTYTRELIVQGDGADNDESVTVWIPNQLGNDELEWEKHTTVDVGVELGLFQNRLNIESVFFNKEVTDVLFERPLPSHVGFSFVYDNIGEIQTYGWEHSLNAILVDEDEFQVTLNANASFIKSYVRELTDENDFLTGSRAEDWQYQFAVDDLIGNWTGYILDGVYGSPEELANATGSTQVVEYGLYKFEDVNLDGIADDNDISVLGNTLPFVTGGLGLDIRWRNFDFNTFFQYSQGADIINANITSTFTATNPGQNTLASIVESTYIEGNPSAESSSSFRTNNINANRNVEDGSFIRWSNLGIGYSLPKEVLSNAKLTSARISIQANNLMVFTKYTWFDPEVNSTAGATGTFLPGFDDTVYPRNRMWQVSINLGL